MGKGEQAQLHTGGCGRLDELPAGCHGIEFSESLKAGGGDALAIASCTRDILVQYRCADACVLWSWGGGRRYVGKNGQRWAKVQKYR